MPLFLPRDRWSEWMDSDIQDVNEVRKLMIFENPDQHLRFWPVADLVNSIRNNGPELIEPIVTVPETLF